MADDTRNENFQWIPAQMPAIFEDVFAEDAFTEGTMRQETLTVQSISRETRHNSSNANCA